MAKYEFKFVVSSVDLSSEHQERVSRAVAQAASLALAEVTPADAVTVRFGNNLYWRGLPPAELLQQLQNVAAQEGRQG